MVTVEAVLDGIGNVVETRVVNGPNELRRAAQQAVLQWHFATEGGSNTRQVKINFQLPAGTAMPTTTIAVQPGAEGTMDPAQASAAEAKIRVLRSQITEQIGQLQAAQDPTARQQAAARLNEMQANVSTLQRNLVTASLTGQRVARINVVGVSDKVREDLMSRLPIHVGDTLSADSMERTMKTVQEFDEHMTVSHGKSTSGEVSVTIFAAGGISGGVGSGISSGVAGGVIGGIIGGVPGMASSEPPPGTKQITVGGNVQQAKLVSQARPAYPPLAKQARISGVVHLQTIIAKDGTVRDIRVLSGHPLLIPAALEAVKNWVYQTTLLNGEPVEVMTQVDVNFTLSDDPPQPGGGQ